MWSYSLGGIGHDYAYAVAADPSGNVLATGAHQAAIPELGFAGAGYQFDAYVVKLSSEGTLLWSLSMGDARVKVELAQPQSAEDELSVDGARLSATGVTLTPDHRASSSSSAETTRSWCSIR